MTASELRRRMPAAELAEWRAEFALRADDDRARALDRKGKMRLQQLMAK